MTSPFARERCPRAPVSYRGPHVAEHGENAVSLLTGFHHLAQVPLDLREHDQVVPVRSILRQLGRGIPGTGRALDVGHQERHRASGHIHSASTTARPPASGRPSVPCLSAAILDLN